MIIRKQPIISLLLDDTNSKSSKFDCTPPPIMNFVHREYLNQGIEQLSYIKTQIPNWGLPEYPSEKFKDAINKSAKSFVNSFQALFDEFCNEKSHGILIFKNLGTIVYTFFEGKLHIWIFNSKIVGKSILLLYFSTKLINNNELYFFDLCQTLIYDQQLFPDYNFDSKLIYELSIDNIILYLAVKKYIKVEKIVSKPNTTTKLSEIMPDNDEKVKNESGQKVIIMDSRWFREIVNDNEINVNGFFRMQNKKDENGEWYKERIFVNPFVRHGYHRYAKIDESNNQS